LHCALSSNDEEKAIGCRNNACRALGLADLRAADGKVKEARWQSLIGLSRMSRHNLEDYKVRGLQHAHGVTNVSARNIASANIHLKVLRIAYTSNSDDVFNYYAWEHDRITLDPAEFQRGHISELNQAALEESYDVVAVSSVA
jgi:hypothetical protein